MNHQQPHIPPQPPPKPPQFSRPPPSSKTKRLLPSKPSETKWLNPVINGGAMFSFLWDGFDSQTFLHKQHVTRPDDSSNANIIGVDANGTCVEINDNDKLINLVTSSHNESLTPMQTRELLSLVTINSTTPSIHIPTTNTNVAEYNYKLIINAGLTPQKLNSLITLNPMVAVVFFTSLCLNNTTATSSTSTSSDTYKTYINTLLTLPPSQKSIEVVNRVITHASQLQLISNTLVLDYICFLITSCNSSGSSSSNDLNASSAVSGSGSVSGGEDKYIQNRTIRLVCTFLTSLLKNPKTINLMFVGEQGEGVKAEIGRFCIEFSRVREAAGLFKLLRLN